MKNPNGHIVKILQEVGAELESAQKKFEPMMNGHYGYAVLREEVDELWDEVKKDNTKAACKEAVQVAAMAVRFIHDLRK